MSNKTNEKYKLMSTCLTGLDEDSEDYYQSHTIYGTDNGTFIVTRLNEGGYSGYNGTPKVLFDGAEIPKQYFEIFGELDPEKRILTRKGREGQIRPMYVEYMEQYSAYKGRSEVYINCTPHPICLNSGVSYPTSETIARISVKFVEFAEGKFYQEFGEVEGLPKPIKNFKFIVSALVFGATDRKDVVAPATGHKDTIRNERGQIESVPGFIYKK